MTVKIILRNIRFEYVYFYIFNYMVTIVVYLNVHMYNIYIEPQLMVFMVTIILYLNAIYIYILSILSYN